MVDGTQNTETLDLFEEWYSNYYQDAIGLLAQRYPKDQRSLVVDYTDLYRFDPALADDYLNHPEQFNEYAEEALSQYDLPADIDLSAAHVRMKGLSEQHQFYPNQFSPTEQAGSYRTLKGDVLVSTDTYGKILKAAFECQRCGTLTRVPQSDGEFQEPHECQGCDRQGPFKINHEQSEFVDGETFQLQTPPEQAAGNGRTLQCFVEDDLTSQVGMGDRVEVSGIVHLNQKRNGGTKTTEFEPYLEGHHIKIKESNKTEIDIDPDKRDRIERLAAGDEGDPLELVADSFAPEVHGYDAVKQALVLSIVGGATNTPGVRGRFHVLLIGDPSTAKSVLTGRVKDIALRSVAVSGNQSTSAGLTSTATQGEFSDGRWTLSPGAFVKANEGIIVIDELDDMAPEDRKAMLEPMSEQEINVTKAGINATLATKTAVTAAANPKHGRFDPYENLTEQFVFDSNLLSRFDLVFTFRDTPDETEDTDIADHMTQYRDAKIRQHTDQELTNEQEEIVEQPVSDDLLQMWLALAKQQPDPVFESDEVRQNLRDSFVSLRGVNGYGEDVEVPVTFRKLPGVERIARAYAKLEFSPVVTQDHAETAMNLVGKSMQDYQTNEDGDLDADVAETGESKVQKDRKQAVVDTIQELQAEHDDNNAPEDEVMQRLSDEYRSAKIQHDVERLKEKGAVYSPDTGALRYVGKY